MSKIAVYKSNSSNEPFNPQKLRNSIAKTCLATGSPEKQAELFATEVQKRVEQWLKDKQEVTSKELRINVSANLKNFDQNAGQFYIDFKEII